MHDNISKEVKFISTRHTSNEKKESIISVPRLGRRESEPHSENISYIHDILKTNFPEHRAIWDLHHYFYYNGEPINIQFDISFFLNLKIDNQLSSYHAEKYNNKVPDIVINVLSKSTWRKDLLENAVICENLGIKYYIVFFAYEVSPQFYPPPFLRVYHLNNKGKYESSDITEIMYDKGALINPKAKYHLENDLPFDVALERIQEKYDKDKDIFKIIFLRPNSTQKYLMEKEIEKERADKEKQRADKEKERADKEKERADKEKERAEYAEKLVKELKEKLKQENR
ncbi:hypothetical protein [Candidatus Harpocratesius sp.]